MVNNNEISQSDADIAYNTNLSYIGKSNEEKFDYLYYFRDAVVDELKEIAQIPNSLIETGGLKIYTTLDKKAQDSLEKSVKSEMKGSGDIEVAGMMMNPQNGAVMAIVGGKDYSLSQFNRAINSKRQVGSTMKPFLYYTALESGFTSASSFTSEKTTFTFSNNKSYTPKNYNDKYADGPISMGAAISYSDNIYAVKTHLFLGEETLVNTAKRMGIKKELDEIASLPLGTNELSMLDFANAYTTLASGGYKRDLSFITKVEDLNGNILYEKKYIDNLVLNKSYVYILNELLTSTYNSAFKDYNTPTIISLASKISRKYAMKTGSTSTDCWMVGYNPDILMMVWNGYDDNREVKASDGNIAKNIWVDTIESYNKDIKSWYDKPDNVVGLLLDSISGEEVIDNNKAYVYYFIKGSEDVLNN